MVVDQSLLYAWCMKRSLLLLLCLLYASAGHAEVYKWVDADGSVHYGDSPPSGTAKRVELPELSTYQARQLPVSVHPTETTGKDEEKAAPYSALSILNPKAEATIRHDEGLVDVQVSLSPALRANDRVVLLLDGSERVASGDPAALSLKGVERGGHRLQAVVRDEAGKELLRSDPVRFYLHQRMVKPKPEPAPKSDNGDASINRIIIGY